MGDIMEKEDLIKLKDKISELSEHEKKLRNLYLKSIAEGVMYGPMTGFPSIDRPWVKNYSVDSIMSSIPKRSLYEDLIEYSKDNLSNIAIEYFNSKITYRELIRNIDRVASALYKDGVRKGDVITVSMPYLPETVYTIYALNKLGAVVNMIDPRINKELMSRYIKEAHSNYAIIIDKIEKKIASIKEECGFDKIVSVSPLNSYGNFFLEIFSKFKKSIFTKWNDFISGEFIPTEVADRDVSELAVLEYTSGTSGNPKGVKLSNMQFASLAHFQHESLKNEVGDKFLLIMPPFIAYGLVIGMHGMICEGQHLIMVPNFTLDKAPKMLGKLIDKYQPNYIMGVPNFLNILMNYRKDLSFLKGIIIGGDHLEPEIEKRARDFFAKNGWKTQVFKGWGMTELAACASFTKTDCKNFIGSVGIPLSKINIRILKKDDNNNMYDINGIEATYGEEGCLFVTSPSMTLGYYNQEEETKELIYEDKQGVKWINSGDIFEINEDGALFFKDREKRIVVRPDGHNIPSSQIVNIAMSFEEVEKAMVISTPSRKYNHGSLATLCISLKDKEMSYDDVYNLFSKIEDKCVKNLQPRDRATIYTLVNDIPFTQNAKADFNELMNKVNEMLKDVYIDEESNKGTFVINNGDFKKIDEKNIMIKIKRKILK